MFYLNFTAQQYNFIKYDIKDGLSFAQIADLETYDDGRLIIATSGSGFDIYDGQEFQNINSTNGLANNNVFCIEKVNNKILWIGTEKGLTRFDGNETINYFKEDGLTSNQVWALAVANDGVLWIGTDKGLATCVNGRIETIEDKRVSKTGIWSLFIDSKGTLWIGTDKHLIKYYSMSKTFEIQIDFPEESYFLSFVEDKNGNIWAGTEQGLYKINGKQSQLFTKQDGVSLKNISASYVDNENNIWFGGDEGLTLYSDNKFVSFGIKDGFTDYKVWSIKKDLEKNLWIGTDEGLYKITDFSYKIYKEFEDRPIDVWTIVETNKNEFLVSSELQGLLSFIDGKFSKIELGDIKVKGLSTIHIDVEKNLWVGCYDGIFKYAENSYTRSIDKYTDVFGSVSHIFDEGNNNFRFSTFGEGAIKYDSGEFTKVYYSDDYTLQLFYHLKDKQNRLWVATSYGLRLVENDSASFPKGFEWTSNYSVLNLIEDRAGFIWAGTYENGLFCFNADKLINVKFDTVSVEHGLSNASIMGITIDEENNLWVSTNGGLNRIDLNEYHRSGKKTILSYNLKDGIPGTEGFQNGILMDSQNNILIGTIEGLVVLDPKKVKENQKPPAIIIKELKVIDNDFNEIKFKKEELESLDSNYIELPYFQNNLTFGFVGVSLTNPSKVKYSFKLNNSEWSKPSFDAKAYLPNLPYGKYKISVKAANNNGVWSKKSAVLNFEIISPIWRKVWFQFLLALTFVGLFLLFYLFRLNKMHTVNKDLEERINERIKYEAQLKRSEKELILAKEEAEKSDRLKSEFLAQMSHEIRTPINSILSYSSLLKELLSEKLDETMKGGFTTIENSSRRLIRTIDSILNMSQLQTGSLELNKKDVNLNQIINDLYQEFNNVASDRKLRLKLKLMIDKCIIFADQYTVTQMIANMIDNSIKYTEKGSIEIRLIKTSDQKTILEIEDTGIGMSEEFQKKLFTPFTQEEQGYTRKYDGSGLGLSLVQKYAKINKIKLSFTSVKGVGTTFRIDLTKIVK